MAYAYKTYKLSRLHLDLANPRMRRATDEASAQEKLLEGYGDAVVNLGKHIAKHGLNPIDPWAVVRESGKLIVVEGNRRLTACRLLLDPQRTRNRKVATSFSRIRAEVPQERYENITCALFDTRAEARLWIEIKHHGYSNGVGTAAWGPEMVYLDARQNGAKRIRWNELWIFLEDLAGQDSELAAAITAAREAQYTLLDRLVEAGLVEELNLSWDGGGFEGTIGAAERELLLILFSDMSSSPARVNSRSINDVDSATKYLAACAERAADRSMEAQDGAPDDGPERDEEPSEDGSSGGATGDHPADPGDESSEQQNDVKEKSKGRQKAPSTTLLKGCHSSGYNPRLQKLIRQATKLKFNSEGELCGIVLRVVLDLTTQEYWRAAMTGDCPGKLPERLKKIIRHLEPNPGARVEDLRYKEMRGISAYVNGGEDMISKLIANINDYVHNPVVTAGAPFAGAMSDAFEPLITIMSKELRSLDR